MLSRPSLRLSYFAALLLGCGATPTPVTTPAADPAPAARPIARLDNGLRIHVARRETGPVVDLQLWLPTGAMHGEADALGTPALAAVLAGDRLGAALRPVGGSAEAWARTDATALTATVPVAEVDAALAAMARVITTAPDEGSASRATRRVEAMGISAARNPERAALRRVLGAAWGDHPAGRPLIGTTAPSTAAAEAFRSARYRPKGAVLVAVGPIDHDTLTAAARTALGGWRGAPPVSPSAKTPTIDGPTVTVDAAEGPGRVWVGWPIPMATPADAAAADVLARLLEESATAAVRSVDPQARVRSVVHAPATHGMLVVGIRCAPEAVDAVWLSLLQAAASLGRTPVSDGRLAAIVEGLEPDGARDGQSIARHLGRLAVRWPDVDAWSTALGRLESETVRALAERSVRPKALSAVIVAPPGADPGLWSERLVEAARGIRAPAQGTPLPEGIDLQVVTRAGTGSVAVHLRTQGGSATVPTGLAGAGRIAARRLEMPIGGVKPTARLTPEALEVWATMPVADFAPIAGALVDRLAHPDRSIATHERARAAAKAHQAHVVGRVESRARALIVDALATRAGASVLASETVDGGLDTLPPARLAAWHDAFVAHGALRITVVGDVTEADVHRVFGGGRLAARGRVEMMAIPPSAVAPDPAIPRAARRVDGEEAAWGLGWPLGRISDDEVGHLEVALAIVAAAAADVRVDVVVHTGRDTGRVYLIASGSEAAVRAAIPQIISTLNRVTQIAPTGAGLQAAVRARVGQKAVALRTPAAMAAWISSNAHAGHTFLGPRAFAQWTSALERSQGSPARTAAQTHLAIDARSEVWVGPGEPPVTPEPRPKPAEAAELPPQARFTSPIGRSAE